MMFVAWWTLKIIVVLRCLDTFQIRHWSQFVYPQRLKFDPCMMTEYIMIQVCVMQSASEKIPTWGAVQVFCLSYDVFNFSFRLSLHWTHLKTGSTRPRSCSNRLMYLGCTLLFRCVCHSSPVQVCYFIIYSYVTIFWGAVLCIVRIASKLTHVIYVV